MRRSLLAIPMILLAIAADDPKASPKSIDLTYAAGDLKGLTVKGIYRLQGDTFVLCRTLRPKDERPTEFGSEAGSLLVSTS